MEALLLNNNFQLVKRDLRQLKSHIFNQNKINDWDKIIILYNFYLFFSHAYISYYLLDIVTKKNNNIKEDFKSIFLFFFILCNLRTSYLYFILNIRKIDVNLSESLYKNTKQYFQNSY